MRSFLVAGAAMLLGAAVAAPAMAEGPRPSSENNWPGMTNAQPAPQYAVGAAAQYPQAVAPHYVWQEGYDRGGKWHGHWALVQ